MNAKQGGVLLRRSLQLLRQLAHQHLQETLLSVGYDLAPGCISTYHGRWMRKQILNKSLTNLCRLRLQALLQQGAHLRLSCLKILYLSKDQQRTINLLVSISPRWSPSESAAILDPINVWRSSLGAMKQVATTNCHSLTASIDFEDTEIFVSLKNK